MSNIFEVPMRQLTGNEVAVQIRYLVRYHFGEAQSLYQDGRTITTNYSFLMGYYLPPWQRPEVWSVHQKQKFVESLFLGFDIGRLVVSSNINNETDGWLIDGQQRLSALRDFVENKFFIFNEKYYRDLPESQYPEHLYQNATPWGHWESSWFPVMTLQGCDESTLKELYYRLNYGGVAHTQADLERLYR